MMNKFEWAIIVGLGISFGATLFLNAILVREVGPLGISALRVGLGAMAVWALVFLNGRTTCLSVGYGPNWRVPDPFWRYDCRKSKRRFRQVLKKAEN